MSILLGMIPALLGLLTSFLPNLVKYLENGQKFKHEIELTKLRMEAAREGMDHQLITAGITATVQEGESLRLHDSTISSSEWINDVRALVRPVITYCFFGLFVIIKLAAASLLWRSGYDAFEIINVVWDPYTVSMFGAICGFYFGTRSMVYVNETFFGTQNTTKPTTIKK